MKKLLIPLVLFLALSVFLYVGLFRDPREVPSPLIDKPAPAFSAQSLKEPARSIKREDLLGKVWVLNVFASWCEACRQEHPLLMEWNKDNKVVLIGMDYKDERVDGLGWLNRFGNPYTDALFDPKGDIGFDYGVYAVPETFVIDKTGTIRLKHIGPITPEVLSEKIDPLLKKLNG